MRTAVAYEYRRLCILFIGLQRYAWSVPRSPIRYTGAVTDDRDLDKLNAIVGAAIRALCESGADDAFIGAFAATHRAKVAKVLGQSAVVSEPPDIEQVVKHAVGQALTEAGVRARKPRVAKKRAVYIAVAGQRTSVSLSTRLVDQISQAKGGAAEARAFIQSVAEQIPPAAANRSQWLEAHLEKHLAALLAFREGPPGLAAH